MNHIPIPPIPQQQPAPPRRSYFARLLRNPASYIGLTMLLAIPFLISVPATENFNFSDILLLWLLVGAVLCFVGLFFKLRLLSYVGCGLTLFFVLVMLAVMVGAGQWHAPERIMEEEVEDTIQPTTNEVDAVFPTALESESR
ncbi:MAG: hypothetical protein IJ808_00460 [Muribaculaceae bacterium]|nr:hypothetical protein [Muribaculaceae bacterium]